MTMKPYFGGAARRQGTAQSRFAGTTHTGDHHDLPRDHAALPAGHLALRKGRTLYPTRRFHPDDAPRLLVSGYNNAKTGTAVTKGRWRGAAIYTLTLEERATCPRSCPQWEPCYGNAMPMSRRVVHGESLIRGLAAEIPHLLKHHRAGIAVRLHVLGDFWSVEYAAAWYRWLHDHHRLRVWGYTAHPPGSDIGAVIAAMNLRWPDRCVIRTSVANVTAEAPLQATTAWMPAAEATRTLSGIVCPAQTGSTECCGTCALCWAPAANEHRIIFLGHGKPRRGASHAPSKRVVPSIIRHHQQLQQGDSSWPNA